MIGDGDMIETQVGMLSRDRQQRLADLAHAVHAAYHIDRQFLKDTHTPWARPGAMLGVTEAVVGQRIHRDLKAFAVPLGVGNRYLVEAEMADIPACPNFHWQSGG
jgi:hypothetical protein